MTTGLSLRRALVGAALASIFGACATARAPSPAAAPEPDAAGDPAKAEVRLPCADGWNASLVIDNDGTGIWTVKPFQVFPQYACPELVGCDDRGRLLVMVSYSGKWTPHPVIEDGRWLGGLTHGDVDPRVDGEELYSGGQNGNLFQVLSYRNGKLDYRQIAEFAGKEIHTIVSGDLDLRSPGSELLVFTRPGGLYRVAPTGPHGTFATELLAEIPGRIRDAIVLPGDAAPEIATVARSGEVGLLRIDSDGPHWSTIHRATMGKGRLALRPAAPGEPVVLYSTQDDGVVLRHERTARDAWRTEDIYLGPQGLRGIATGRFHADPSVESVAVFGYSGRVELLTRGPAPDDGWSVETLFVDRDKGHWLGVGELDGRNGTDELFGSGYAGRIFLLSRPPGYGRSGVTVDPEPKAPDGADTFGRAPRIGVRAGDEATTRLSTLTYGGGFETKTLAYETLVTRAADGSLAPGLARAWRHEDGGRTLVLTLRHGARFHDGTSVDAEAVREHFERWLGRPEHGWLPSHGKVARVVARSPRELAIELVEPWALLPELCAVNPCGVEGPATYDPAGAFARPVGTGPYRFAGAQVEVLRYERVADGRRLELVRLGERSAVDALLAGDVDAVADGWTEVLARDELAALSARKDLRVDAAPGGAVVYLSMRADGGRCADVEMRRSVRAALDRAELVEAVEHGYADPCATWAAPALSAWPPAGAPTPPRERRTLAARDAPLVLLVLAEDARASRVADAVADQLERAGLRTRVRVAGAEEHATALASGAWDLRVEETWGTPYDPHLSFVHRFLPRPVAGSAATDRAHGVSAALAALAAELAATPEESARRAVHARIQACIDADAQVVPLYAPQRIAAWRPTRGTLGLGPDPYRLAWRFRGDAPAAADPAGVARYDRWTVRDPRSGKSAPRSPHESVRRGG